MINVVLIIYEIITSSALKINNHINCNLNKSRRYETHKF